MLYENGKPREGVSGESIDLSEVEKLIRSSNAELLSSIVQQLKASWNSSQTIAFEEDYSKETISKLAKMMGEKRDEDVHELGRKIEINSNTEQDQKTIDLLRSLGET